MRNVRLLILGFAVLALAVASGCAKHQLTKSETSRLDAIGARISEAERIGAPDCVPPKELARAKVALEHAQHEMLEHYATSEVDVNEAESAANDLLAKTRACVDAKKPTTATAPSPPPPVAAPASPVTAPAPSPEEKPAFESIYFDFDKSFIREDAKPALMKAAEHMEKNPDARIRIEGNCDERGNSEYNMALGERRAESAKKYLVNLGIAASRLSTISYGKERPICAEHNEQCWQKNRRGDLVLQK
jgi:peptidoglycan-associated lipoprotein